MGKKKPFSAKAKREQLRQKRLAASGSTSPSHARSNPKATTSALSPQVSLSTTTPSANAPHRLVRSRAPRGTHAQRFRLQLTEAEASSTRHSAVSQAAAHTTIQLLPVVETAVDQIRPYPDHRFSMPRRPPWRYDDTIDQVDRRENAALRAWREHVVAGTEVPPFFERNLETWRQLWRVMERSDVFVLVVDIRYPALHFVPDLYFYVTENLQKGMVLAINKCDLVPLHVLSAWRQYFQQTYPRLAVAMFSSFPDAKLAPSEHNSELLSKRERRMARSKLAAWGADKLLAALNSLHLEPKKKAYLEEWRSHLHFDISNDEDDLKTSSFLSNEMQNRPFRRTDHSVAPTQPQPKKRDLRKRRRAKFIPAEAENDTSDEPQQVVERDYNADFGGENMITIGIIGHPNAGKSSLINGIFRKKVVSTSQTPGHTKHLQTIFITENVQLCDCPGLVFPGLAPRELQILAGMFPVAQVREPLSVVKYLAERVDLVKTLKLAPEVSKLEDFLLESEYVKDGWTAWKICEAWAMKRGYRTAKAARLDVPRAANHILRLAVDGRIVLSTVPRGYQKQPEGGDVGGDSCTDDVCNSTDENSEEHTLQSVQFEGDSHSESENDTLYIYDSLNEVSEETGDYGADHEEESSVDRDVHSSRSVSSDSESAGDMVDQSNGNSFALLGEE